MYKMRITKTITRNVKIDGVKYLVNQSIISQTIKVIDTRTNKPIYTYDGEDGSLKYVKAKVETIDKALVKAKVQNYILYK